MMNIGIIGLGNIGNSLISGLRHNTEQVISAYDKNWNKIHKAKDLSSKLAIELDCESVINKSSIIFLCIRTEQVLDWLDKYSTLLKNKTIVLFQSGISLSEINDRIPQNVDVMRAITNVNTASNKGHTVILRSYKKDLDEVVRLFEEIGKVIVVDSEEKLDQLSLITGCIPAITGVIMQSLYDSENTFFISNNLLATQNLINEVVIHSISEIENQEYKTDQYIKSVCTKGGILEECIDELKEDQRFVDQIKHWIDPIRAKFGTEIDKC